MKADAAKNYRLVNEHIKGNRGGCQRRVVNTLLFSCLLICWQSVPLFAVFAPSLIRITIYASYSVFCYNTHKTPKHHPLSADDKGEANNYVRVNKFSLSMKKIIKSLLKYFLAPLLLLCLTTVVGLLSYRAYLQNKVRQETKLSGPNAIESLEEVKLGGLKQWILIRGSDRYNPVLLHLHGGPGSADILLARHFDKRLVQHFIVVHWDQRGAGKSYDPHIPLQRMKRDEFVSDVRELSETLTKSFNVPKIYLVGHSWGSEIGILAASRYPELYYAFVGVGQVAEKTEQEEISYRFVLEQAKKSGDEKAVQELEAIGAPPYANDKLLGKQRTLLERFGGVTHNRISFGDFVRIGLVSPDYSLADGLRFFRGQTFSEATMYEERLHTNLFKEVPRIEVPVYFFVGKYDYNTPFELAVRYYEQLDAPRGKQLIWFENSAHMVPYEEPDRYCDILVNKVLKETCPKRPALRF
jgi:pimeloyl-ACP methyl ester carboxylesterase